MNMPLRSAAAAAALLALTAHAADPVPYPDGYRHWTHVKTLTLHEGHPLEDPFKGIHHVYANAAALAGVQGGHYADGAVLAFDLLQALSADNATAEGERVLLGVMVRDRARYAATGGWGFEAFAAGDPARPLASDGGTSCFGCHEQVADREYVFSKWRP